MILEEMDHHAICNIGYFSPTDIVPHPRNVVNSDAFLLNVGMFSRNITCTILCDRDVKSVVIVTVL
jgi:hypothetical protein